MNKVLLYNRVIFTILLIILLVNSFVVNSRLKSIEQGLQVEKSNSTPRMQTQYLFSPPPEGGTNKYYEGFFRDYGDGEMHPHRQALMLLLSHLASLAERPAVTDLDTTGDEKD